MTDKPYIEDADKYITAVHLALPLYQAKTTDRATGVYKIVPEETLRFSDYNYGRRITGMLEEIGIPFYIHVSPQTWKNVGVSKSKTITSWKEFEQTLRESATNVESAPTVSSLTGDDKEEDEYGEEEIRLFTAAAAAILAGEEKMLTDDVVGDRRWVKEHERKRKAKMFFHMLAKAPAAAANEIQNALHNNSSKPKSRDTIESLASLMRSIKQRDLKGFADYLSQVYKSNHPRGETNY